MSEKRLRLEITLTVDVADEGALLDAAREKHAARYGDRDTVPVTVAEFLDSDVPTALHRLLDLRALVAAVPGLRFAEGRFAQQQ